MKFAVLLRSAKLKQRYRFSLFRPLFLGFVSRADFKDFQWLPEVRELAPDAHVVLLGMKTELRDDTRIKELLSEKGLVPVTHEDGERVAREIGATRYLEGTVIDRESVVRVLEAIVGLM